MAAGCSVLIERTVANSSDPMNFADIQIYNSAGAQYMPSQLAIGMSSQHPSGPAANCLDGNPDTYCLTGDSSSAWIRVGYPCADGISRVDIFNRKSDQPRVLQSRVRVQSATSLDIVPAFSLATVQDFYTWPIGERPGCPKWLYCLPFVAGIS